jgi:hypothetical protein
MKYELLREGLKVSVILYIYKEINIWGLTEDWVGVRFFSLEFLVWFSLSFCSLTLLDEWMLLSLFT